MNAFTRVITNGHDCDCLKPQGKLKTVTFEEEEGGGIDRKIFNFEGLQIAEVSQKNLNLINAAVYALDGLVDDGGRKKNIFLLCKIIRKSDFQS